MRGVISGLFLVAAGVSAFVELLLRSFAQTKNGNLLFLAGYGYGALSLGAWGLWGMFAVLMHAGWWLLAPLYAATMLGGAVGNVLLALAFALNAVGKLEATKRKDGDPPAPPARLGLQLVAGAFAILAGVAQAAITMFLEL